MTIEARDGFFGSVKQGIPLKDAIMGKRTWSPLGIKVVSNSLGGSPIAEIVYEPSGPDALLAQLNTYGGYKNTTGDKQVLATQDEINDPKRPWSGQIRWTPDK